MKKYTACLLTVILALSLLTACNTDGGVQNNGQPRIKIVTTIFPEYDWVMNILGDKAENTDVVLLTEKGVDLHSFQPTFADMMNISKADVFVYVGGESDGWVEDVLKNAENKNMQIVNLMEVLGDSAKEEEIIEGMESEEEEGVEEAEYDEHVWLSVKNASLFVKAIEKAVESADPSNADAYRNNADAYLKELEELDNAYSSTVSSSQGKLLLFADRFPFRYLTDDYGLDYYAAFVGCSTETQASFNTIMFLSDKADENNLSSVIIIEGSDGKIAEAVNNNSDNKDRKILTMDSMQSVSMTDINDGATYISIMEKNLEVLKEALN